MAQRTAILGLFFLLALVAAFAPRTADAQTAAQDQYYVGYQPQTKQWTLAYTSAANPALINGPATLVRGGFQQRFGPATRVACVAFLKSVKAPGW